MPMRILIVFLHIIFITSCSSGNPKVPAIRGKKSILESAIPQGKWSYVDIRGNVDCGYIKRDVRPMGPAVTRIWGEGWECHRHDLPEDIRQNAVKVVVFEPIDASSAPCNRPLLVVYGGKEE